MSALGQKRTHAVQQKGLLFDHLIGAPNQRRWNGETERLCGLEVDDQLDFRGLNDRQLRRPFAFEDTAGVDADLAERFCKTAAVTHQASARRKRTILVDCGHLIASSERGKLFAESIKYWISTNDERACAQFAQSRECHVEVAFGAGAKDMKL